MEETLLVYNSTHCPFSFSPAQANCLSLGEINSSQLVFTQPVQQKGCVNILKLSYGKGEEA